MPVLCILASPSRILSDVAIDGPDHEGNARIRRIVDDLILIDGDLQYIARVAVEARQPVQLERRASRQ